MCEWCDRLKEAAENKDARAYDQAKVSWIKAHVGEDAAMVYTVATREMIDSNMDRYEDEMGNAMHLAGWSSAEAVKMFVDSPLELLLSKEVISCGALLMDTFSTIFWYGLFVGKRDRLAKRILMGQVADVP